MGLARFWVFLGNPSERRGFGGLVRSVRSLGFVGASVFVCSGDGGGRIGWGESREESREGGEFWGGAEQAQAPDEDAVPAGDPGESLCECVFDLLCFRAFVFFSGSLL